MPRLDFYEFSEQLLKTRDLDPVYIVLWEADLERDLLRKWLLAYWCFYHCGTASWIVDQSDYWGAMQEAAGSKEWPRASERRHFRGENARKSVEFLQGRGIPRLFAPFDRAVEEGSYLSIGKVIGYVSSWKGFGPWISFKVADMLERLGLCRVSTKRGIDYLFDSPRKGAEDVWNLHGNGSQRPGDVLAWAVDSLLIHLGRVRACPEGIGWGITHLKRADTSNSVVSVKPPKGGTLAPPRYERPVGIMEAETCLCKFHSYLGGHYEIGKDIEEVGHGLDKFLAPKTSRNLRIAGERAGLW